MRAGCIAAILIVAGVVPGSGSTLGRGGVSLYRHMAGLDFAVAAPGPDGSLIVGGTASADGLPVTPDAVHSNFRSSICPAGGLPYQAACVDGYVAKFAADGTLLFGTYLIGGANVTVMSVTPAPDGAIYAAVMANAGVDGVPNPLSMDGATHLHIVRLSADGTGSVSGFMVTAVSRITPAKLAVDRDGNVYVGGTCGAAKDQTGCVISFGPGSFGPGSFGPGSASPRFVTNVGAAPGSVNDLTLDDQGNVYLAGSTATTDFPGASLGWNGVQPGDLAFDSSYGFVALLDPGGGSILWSSVFGSPLSGGAVRVLRNARGEIAVVAFAVQNPMFRFNPDLSTLNHISVVKFAGDSTRPVYAVQVAAGIENNSIDAAMDDGGAVLLTGVTTWLQPGGIDSPPLATTCDALERCVSGTRTRFFMRLAAADGSVEYSSFFGPDQQSAASRVVLGRGSKTFVLMTGATPMDLSFYGGPDSGTGSTGTGLVVLDPALAPARARLCAVNAANFRPDSLAAGSLITLFGSDLGTEITLNGEPIPLIAADPNRIVAFLPSMAPSSARLEAGSGELTQAIDVQIKPSAPGLFPRLGTIAAAVVNEDGAANGPDNPAPRGSVVRVYGTGFGGGAPESFIGNQSARLVSIGPAPSSPPGVTELRIQVPQALPPLFQRLANFQFRSGLYILQTNLFLWVK
jgi:uncharacterized protein (TIGR03437 family)